MKLNETSAGRKVISRAKPSEWEMEIVKNACLWSYSRIFAALMIVFIATYLIANLINPFVSNFDLSAPFAGLNGLSTMMLLAAYMMIILPAARIVWTLPSLEEENEASIDLKEGVRK